MSKKPLKIVIAGGGTGGHVFPAIAIADAIKQQRPDTEILFVGAKGKIEMEAVPKAGYPIEGLTISGFQRKLTWRNLLFPFRLLGSLWKASGILKRFRPDAAVGVGGYASGPILEMAVRKKIPTVIQEQNSFPGVTNRLLAPKVNRICVAYEGMEKYFPKGKISLTGNPLRKGIQNLEGLREKAAESYGFDPSKKTIVVMGGSLGARSINEAMKLSASLLAKRSDVQVFWQAGKLYVDEYAASDTARLPSVKITGFIDKMEYAYALADVLITRAGALTISELCLVGKPAILVPSPNVAEDHQTKNAMALVEKEAALYIKDSDADEEMIPAALRVLQDENLAQKLGQNIRKMARPDAGERIAKEILNQLNL